MHLQDVDTKYNPCFPSKRKNVDTTSLIYNLFNRTEIRTATLCKITTNLKINLHSAPGVLNCSIGLTVLYSTLRSSMPRTIPSSVNFKF